MMIVELFENDYKIVKSFYKIYNDMYKNKRIRHCILMISFFDKERQQPQEISDETLERFNKRFIDRYGNLINFILYDNIYLAILVNEEKMNSIKKIYTKFDPDNQCYDDKTYLYINYKTILYKDNEYSYISAFARRLKYKIKDWLKIKES